MRVLVVNAGSSSVKLRVLDRDDRVAFSRDLPAIQDESEAIRADLDRLGDIDAVGHRFVHGGPTFTGPVVIDDAVEEELLRVAPLAPQHQRASLRALQAVRRSFPQVPAVASFDTAFHATLPLEASTYAIPREWSETYGVRRYGFHGLSHAYAARRAAEVLHREIHGLRVVTCHLGAGASLAAVRDGRSIDTTMGFTPLEGLVMATRSGTVDPGLVLWLQRHAGLTADDVGRSLESRSGLLALAGNADMRAILNAAEAGEERARLAVDVYIHRLSGAIAGMGAALGGMDALVFTGGVGENAWQIRAMAIGRLAFLGAAIDHERNRRATPEVDVATEAAAVRCVVVASREDLEIAREVRRTLS